MNGNVSQWTISESARLIHVVCDPSVGLALARLAHGMTRSELDARLANPFLNEFHRLYNDQSFKPAHPKPSEPLLRGIDPNRFPQRDGGILKTKFADIRKHFTISYNMWNVSGQNQRDNFWNFCNGKKTSYYAFLVWDGPSIDIVLRTVNDGTNAFHSRANSSGIVLTEDHWLTFYCSCQIGIFCIRSSPHSRSNRRTSA